jgi:hypothetical protein
VANKINGMTSAYLLSCQGLGSLERKEREIERGNPLISFGQENGRRRVSMLITEMRE